METASKTQALQVPKTAAQQSTTGKTLPSVPVFQPKNQSTPTLKEENKSGLPHNLKSSLESLSGYDMNDVRVHYNSSKPAQFKAFAYAQGADIHIAPGQERHLPHEAWHVVQQKQGRVQPIPQMKEGLPINNDVGLEKEADVMGNKAITPTSLQATALTTLKTTPVAQRSSIQFTLVDAQAWWLQWYKSANADEEKIQNYILAKKRGWDKLKFELERRPPDVEMGEEVVEEENSNGMMVDVPMEQPIIHEEDKDAVQAIIEKQSQPVSSTEGKHETDKRKLTSLYRLVGNAQDDESLLFRSFFVKNAPAGYNRSAEVEDEHYEFEFDPHYERDFTFYFGKKAEERQRTQTDYFRTTTSDSHKHVSRKRMDNQLRSHMIKTFPKKKNEIKQKQVYLSFYVEIPDNDDTLKIIAPITPYESPNMLGANPKDTGSVVRLSVDINGHPLTLWVNKKSVGQQSRYNASAIVPNILQTHQIMQALNISTQVNLHYINPELENDIPEQSFQPSTMDYVYGTDHVQLPGADYKRKLLSDRRTTIKLVSDKINQIAKGKYVRAITADMTQGFLQYPCLILEPLPDFKEDFELTSGNLVDDLKSTMVYTLHELFDISFGNRASFGFAYPTVGDVGSSVRIWPGLVDQSIFSQLIFKTLCKAQLISDAPEALAAKDDLEPPPILEALTRAIGRARERYHRYQDLKNGGNIVRSEALYEWVINRITSNVIKATELIRLLTEQPSSLPLTKRAVRTLENLNEYDLLQAGAEEQQYKDAPNTNRTKELLDEFKAPIMLKQVQGWSILAVKLRSSGMDAYRGALEIVGDAQKESSRLYFETAKVNHEIKTNVKGLTKAGSITKMMDPSYNFVDQSDVDKKKPFEWPKEKNYPSVHIYDITNTTIDDTFSKINPQNKPDFTIFFESMSKHFQFGMDKSTIGRLIVYINTDANQNARIEEIKQRAEYATDTIFSDYVLNYLALQNRFYGI